MRGTTLKASRKNCEDRHFKCHMECEKYIEYTKALDEIKEIKRREGITNDWEIKKSKRLARFRRH